MKLDEKLKRRASEARTLLCWVDDKADREAAVKVCESLNVPWTSHVGTFTRHLESLPASERYTHQGPGSGLTEAEQASLTDCTIV